MAATLNVDALTNSAMMALEKEMRKNGLAASTHRHYDGNRRIMRGMIQIMLQDAMEAGDVPRS